MVCITCNKGLNLPSFLFQYAVLDCIVDPYLNFRE